MEAQIWCEDLPKTNNWKFQGGHLSEKILDKEKHFKHVLGVGVGWESEKIYGPNIRTYERRPTFTDSYKKRIYIKCVDLDSHCSEVALGWSLPWRSLDDWNWLVLVCGLVKGFKRSIRMFYWRLSSYSNFVEYSSCWWFEYILPHHIAGTVCVLLLLWFTNIPYSHHRKFTSSCLLWSSDLCSIVKIEQKCQYFDASNFSGTM